MTPPELLLQETETFLHDQIPLAKAMGVKVESFTEEALTISAPLEPNHNHLGTAFGGSLSVLATLAGYSVLWLEMGDREAHIVIRSSSIQYLHPVRGVLRAVCRRPGPEELDRFRKQYEKSGKARMVLHVTLSEEGRECVLFEGIYVALR
jgi:thioesterase domain-containing protein